MQLCFCGQVSTVEELRRYFATPAETPEAPAAAEAPPAAEAPAAVEAPAAAKTPAVAEAPAAPLPDAEESKQKRLAARGGGEILNPSKS